MYDIAIEEYFQLTLSIKRMFQLLLVVVLGFYEINNNPEIETH